MTGRHLTRAERAAIPDEDWALAKQREKVIREIVRNPLPPGARREQIEAAAAELGVSPHYVYRLAKIYAADPQVQALVPGTPGRKKGTNRIDPAVEAIITDEIKTEWMTQLKPKLAPFVRGVHAKCGAAGLVKPTKRTVAQRIATLSKREQMKKREGARKAQETYGAIRGEWHTERPLEFGQIDHTPGDIHVIDPDGFGIIGRATISVVMDVHTRVTGGFFLSLDPPCASSVAACLAHGVMDKTAWLAARGFSEEACAAMPALGFFDKLGADNAAEFRREGYARACENYGIEPVPRRPGRPQDGGHIERRLRSLSQELHLLDGTTFSNIKERGAYDSEGRACLTLAELEFMVASIIIEQNVTYHEGIKTTPLAKWRRDTEGLTLRRPQNVRDFYRDFLPCENRSVTRDRFRLHNLFYRHPALRPFNDRREKVTVHYDPSDLGRVYVRGPSGDFIEVLYADRRLPAMSKWENLGATRALRAKGRRDVDERLIGEMVLARRRLRDEARSRSRAARREHARQTTPAADRRLFGEACGPVIDGVAVEIDDEAPLRLPYRAMED